MAEPTPTADPSFARAIAEEGVAILGDLARLGLRLGETLERHVLCAEEVQVHQAKIDPDVMIMPACDLAGVALSFNRIGRAIRMTLALRQRLAEGRSSRSPPETRAPSPRPTAPESADGPDRVLREEARESLFDTPDVEKLLDTLVRDLPACAADAPQESPSAGMSDRSAKASSANNCVETTLPPSLDAGPAHELAKPP